VSFFFHSRHQSVPVFIGRNYQYVFRRRSSFCCQLVLSVSNVTKLTGRESLIKTKRRFYVLNGQTDGRTDERNRYAPPPGCIPATAVPLDRQTGDLMHATHYALCDTTLSLRRRNTDSSAFIALSSSRTSVATLPCEIFPSSRSHSGQWPSILRHPVLVTEEN